jgi:hypothetical protein
MKAEGTRDYHMRGKCLCGKVEFEVLGRIARLYQCHCGLCRKQSGSSSNTATIVTENHFRWLAGKEGISSWVKDTGFRSDFCSTCGSPVPNPLRSTDYWWIPAGLLEGESEAKVAAHLFIGSKASWDEITGTASRYDEMPQLLDIVTILHPNIKTRPSIDPATPIGSERPTYANDSVIAE